MPKKKLLLIILSIVFIILFVIGASYAFWSFSSNNKDIVFRTSSNLKNYIHYSSGEGVFTGTLQVGDDYTDGIHTTISIYKDNAAENVILKATVHLDVNQIGTNMQSSKALKWAVTNGDSTNPGSIISTGDFVGATNNSSMIIAADLNVTLAEKEYTVWIWLDERENPSQELVGETLDTNVWMEVNQYEGVANVFEITRISASYQTITATVINRKNVIVDYEVTTTNVEPSTWNNNIPDNEKNNIYNLRYVAPAAGNYYVWFKDSKGNIIHSDLIAVSQVNNNAPVCSFGEFSRKIIKNNATATIDITCIDENTTIINDLKLSDLTRTGTTVTLTNLTKTKITNGYKYTITVKAGTAAGNTSITLPANKIMNNFNLGNEQIQSETITVNNESTAPTFTLSIPNGGTYAIKRDATITIADNVMLRAGTYTIKYGWSTSALTCNQLTDTVDIVVARGETTKSIVLPITNKNGAGKLYICNQNAIYDEAGNSKAANTLLNANMYLNSGILTVTSNGGVKATLNVLNTTAIPAPYYFMKDTQPITCDENTPSGEFTPSESSSYTFTVNQTGTYYVCAKMSDTSGNTAYFTGSVEVKAYLKTLSGDSVAFKASTYKTNITHIYFVNNMNIPNDAVAQYDLDDTNVGLIKGWIINNSDASGKYKLYIGSNETIYGRTLTNLFKGMTGLTSISFDNFDTSEATTMTSMFSGCNKLISLDLSGFDTSKVTDMQDMFYNCSGLASLDLSTFDTSKVTTMNTMFRGCTGLVVLDLTAFDTSKVTDMNNMFYSCSALDTIYVSPTNWKTSQVTSHAGMFSGCTALVGGNGTPFSASYVNKTRAVIDVSGTPGYLSALPSANVLERSLATGAATKYLSTDIARNKIKKITFTNSISGHSANGTDTWDVSFQKNGSVLAWVGSADANGLYEMTIGQNGGVIPESGTHLFRNLNQLLSIDGMEYLITSGLFNVRCMFLGCSKLPSIDLSHFSTSNVKNMASMFSGCSALTSLNVSNFNTANVTNMSSMFYGCSALTSLNVSNFNTANVTNMSSMFYGCNELLSLDVSNFDTSKVTNMYQMFMNCKKLTVLDLTNFNTSNVKNMERMFEYLSAVNVLDLSSFDTSKVTSMYYAFYGCTNLLTIYVSSTGWVTSQVTSHNAMFQNCSSLVGGNGTVYNSSYINKTYARIDADGTPGYLTEKPTGNLLEQGTMGAATTKYLSTDILKNQIKKITFTNSISGHSANGTDTWDVSLNKNGSVLAWVGSPDGNGKYEMTIGQNGGVVLVSGDQLFRNLTALVTIDGMQYLDTSNVSIMRSMFNGCSSLTTLDLSPFDTSKVKLMNYMFNGCSNLTTIYASGLWNTSNVTSSGNMFAGDTNLPNYNSSVVDVTNAHYNTGGYLTYKAYP